MSRNVWPTGFQLFSRGLTEAQPEQIRKALALVADRDPKPTRFGEHGIPVALRWCTLPALGFPRQPFQVFRRSGRFPQKQINPGVAVNGSNIVEWGRINMFQVIFDAVPAAGQSLTIQALDRMLNPIPGQTIAVAVNTRCRFRAPGTAALRVTGRGDINNVQGSTATECANQPDWELIEVVGFPFDRGEIGAPAYEPVPQGFAPPGANGGEAAKTRLSLASMLHRGLPPTGVATIPAPAWPPPDIGEYLNFLRRDGNAVLPMIEKCLSSTNDGDPTQLQAEFLFSQSQPGIRQADIPGAPASAEDTQFDIPVVGMTLLAVSAESYAATALGYGCIDFPGRFQNPVDAVEPSGFRSDFDYMVTNTFVFIGGTKIELAALAQGRPDPNPASALSAARLRRNRPAARDEAESESVQLRWNHSLLPQGYAVAVSRKAGESHLLNSARPFPQGFELFTPPRGENVNGGPPDGQVLFTDPVSPVPLTGTQNVEYLVAGGDVFGRWSAWTRTGYVSQAPPVQLPGLHSVTASLDPATAVGRKITGELAIEFSWDWADRSPRLIQFHGRFFTPSPNAPAFAVNFQLDSTAAAGPAVVVTFDDAIGIEPVITSGHNGTVEILEPVPTDATRKYRLTLNNFKADFSTQSKRDFAVFARAEEKVRPGLSEVAGPRMTDMFDPLPPAVPQITADLRWTALPDAANRARGVLTWPADPHAAGYIVWEGTEAAVRRAIDPALPDPAPETTLMARALDLTTRLQDPASQNKSLIAFARINTRPLPVNQVELELPGGSKSLYGYRISSVSATNQESARSNAVAWFAVPRRIKPGQPNLKVRPVEGGFEVTAIAAPGAEPSGYKLFRVRNSALLSDPGMKGPPKVSPADPGWQNLVITGRPAKRIIDAVAPSWQPYYYQVVAIGQENLAAGEHSGESAPSPTVAVFLPPAGPPPITMVTNVANAANRLVVFRSNIPAKPTDLGAATIEVFEFVRVPVDGPLTRRPLLSIAALDVPVAAPIAAPPAAVVEPLIRRLKPAQDGTTVFSVVYPATVGRAVIVLRDPLVRTTELSLTS